MPPVGVPKRRRFFPCEIDENGIYFILATKPHEAVYRGLSIEVA